MHIKQFVHEARSIRNIVPVGDFIALLKVQFLLLEYITKYDWKQRSMPHCPM